MNLSRRGHLNSRRGFRPIRATGGVVSEITVAGVRYRLHSFLAVGTHSFEVLDPGSEGLIEYLVVGGGGGGANNYGAGGGGGGFIEGSMISRSAITIDMHVGEGGLGQKQALTSENIELEAQPGEASKIVWISTVIEAAGGGAGGYAFARDCKGGAGASGGGGSSMGPSSFGSGGLGIPGQGHSGASSPGSAGGGGGGAGLPGGGNSRPTSGGDGKQSSITGDAIWYCGGGGGSRENGLISTGGKGGGGGGGFGPSAIGTVAEIDGSVNTGGGGGGRNTGAILGTIRSGNGGSGLIFARYIV